MKRYLASRDAGYAKFAELLEHRPFTYAFGLALFMSLLAAFGYVVVYSDTKYDFWYHFWQSFEIVVLIACAFAFFVWRENKAPLPLRLRRLFWHAIVWGYVGAAVYLLSMAFQPFARVQWIRDLVGLGPILPLPVIAWRLLKKTQNG